MSLVNEFRISVARASIKTLLSYIGEDPDREGLQKTPDRVLNSFKELYSGYEVDPKTLFTVFEKDSCNEMVVLRSVEVASMCEHHMLPFIGEAHIAYIPNGKIVGISKLARLLEVYARRLQIQERLTEQITKAIEDNLQPKGAACCIQAKHLCMCARGVGKQNSVMVTSSLTGAFLKPEVRQEFYNLIKG